MLKSYFIILLFLFGAHSSWAMSCSKWDSASRAAAPSGALVVQVRTEFLDVDTLQARLRVEKIYKGVYSKDFIDFPASDIAFDPIFRPEDGSWIAILVPVQGQYHFAGCAVNGLRVSFDGSVFVPLSTEGEDTKMSPSQFNEYINGLKTPELKGMNCVVDVQGEAGANFVDYFFLSPLNQTKVFEKRLNALGVNADFLLDVYFGIESLHVMIQEPFNGVTGTTSFKLSYGTSYEPYSMYLVSEQGTASIECHAEYGLPLISVD